MTEFKMSDQEQRELTCPKHEEELVKSHDPSSFVLFGQLRCKHCKKEMSRKIDLDELEMKTRGKSIRMFA